MRSSCFCFIFLMLSLLMLSCDAEIENELPIPDPNPVLDRSIYFPPKGSTQWESINPDELGWNMGKMTELKGFLQNNNTRAFLILKEGKIVVEEYWGQNITNTGAFGQESQWYWASAGKSVTAFLTGLAQEQGYLKIEDKSSDYLGQGWTSLSEEQESRITVLHQLTMTTGLDYQVNDLDCTHPECLTYKAAPGTQWYYHNAPYTLLKEVISSAVGVSYEQFTNENLEEKIGMEGRWISNNFNNVYWSRPRDMARFGLLILNKGKWEDEQIMKDSVFYNAMVNTSQDLNPSYGYLWWLNGKGQAILPGFPNRIPTSVAPEAPQELFAAMGKNGQFIDIVPSQKLIVVRMGEAPDGSLVPIKFHDDMWRILSDVIQ